MEKYLTKEKIVYQIYPRSFCDSDRDGIGDIKGIISKLDHLADLGVNTVWLSPIYKSPDDDNGYDISDYKSIQPAFGTMEDFETLVAEARKRGIGIVMDLVINHTSDEHEWFKRALSGEEKYKNYYIIKRARARSYRITGEISLPNALGRNSEIARTSIIFISSQKSSPISIGIIRRCLKRSLALWISGSKREFAASGATL
ncbi:MAG: hypothetical protein IJY18_01070 [Clostridia bacterium]|nr:hypothetical protein [Clostridia bacterium]